MTLLANCHRWIQSLWTESQNSTGIVIERCAWCDSPNVECKRTIRLRPPYEIPTELSDIQDQILRRDNGRCLDCGLEQSFFLFTEEGRKRIYALGPDELSAGEEWKSYPPSEKLVSDFYTRNWMPRLARWQRFFELPAVAAPRNVLALRCFFGEPLIWFQENFGAKTSALEMSEVCRRYIADSRPEIEILDGQLNGRIETPCTERFDLIIVTHVLTHSVNLAGDLERLKSLTADGGMLLFVDEIAKKPHNPFHTLHFDEARLTSLLSEKFRQVTRLDRSGPVSPYTEPFTLCRDNPDLVAWL